MARHKKPSILDEWIYMIGPESGPYKIGLARDVESRLRNLQVGNHQKLYCVESWHCRNARYVEGAIHKALENYRLTGEWFSADRDCLRSRVIEIIHSASDPMDAVESVRSNVEKELVGEAGIRAKMPPERQNQPMDDFTAITTALDLFGIDAAIEIGRVRGVHDQITSNVMACQRQKQKQP